ncbi:MAG: glycosyltransferase family 39 protein [Chthoniobacterales bacterium]
MFRKAVQWWLSQSIAQRFQIAFGIAAGIFFIWMLLSPKPWNVNQINPSVADYVKTWAWWAALLNLPILAVLTMSARFWIPEKTNLLPQKIPFHYIPRWCWGLLIAATLFLAVTAIPRMNYSLNHDERYTVRRTVVGQYKLNDKNEFYLRKAPFRDTLYSYKKPNNHIFYSLTSKLLWHISRLFRPANTRDFADWVLRIPALIGGLVGVFFLGLLLARYVSPYAGVLAAWLLAIHPWYLRYTTEARGYAQALGFLPLTLLCWERALSTHRWRWWFAFAAAQFCLLYSFLGAFYVLLVLNVLTALYLLWSEVFKKKYHQFARWFAVNSIAAILAIQLIFPLIPQYQIYLTSEEAQGGMDRSWLVNSAAFFFSGVPWQKSFSEDMPYLSLHKLAEGNPFLFNFCLWIVSIFFALGLLRFALGNGRVRIIGCTLIFPALLGISAAKLSGQHMFEWYNIYLLPGLVASIALGGACFVEILTRKHRVKRYAPALASITAFAILMPYFFFTQPSRTWHLTNPIEAAKEVVLQARGTLNPYEAGQNEILTASLRLEPDVYDPRCQKLGSADDLLALMRQADAENKPLFVYVGNPWSAAFGDPKLWRLYYEYGLFDDFHIHRSIEPTLDFIVAKYHPHALEQLDLAAFHAVGDSIPNADISPITYSQKFASDSKSSSRK